MEIRPIRTGADYAAALAEVNRLFNAQTGTPEADRFEVLALLVNDYEKRQHRIDPPEPVDAILHALDRLNLTRRDLEPLLGGPNRVSEVLNKQRGLSLSMIRRLSEKLGIPAEVLVRPYPLRDRQATERSRVRKAKAAQTPVEQRRVAA